MLKGVSSFFVSILFCSFVTSAWSADRKENTYEDEQIKVRVFIRTPEQIAAFYQGREFPKNAVDELRKACNFTVLMRNIGSEIIWLELDRWRFSAKGKVIEPLGRDYWQQRWKTLKLTTAHQSTFGWTLLPDSRDLHTDEPVGGGVTLPMLNEPFDVVMPLRTGADKQGKIKNIEFKNIHCKQESTE